MWRRLSGAKYSHLASVNALSFTRSFYEAGAAERHWKATRKQRVHASREYFDKMVVIIFAEFDLFTLHKNALAFYYHCCYEKVHECEYVK